MQDLLWSWSFRVCPWSRVSYPLLLIYCSVDCWAALEQEAEIAIMVIPVIPKRMFLRKLISLLPNWETQTKLCPVLALGAAVRLIPLFLSALITKHLCSCEQRCAKEARVLPVNQQHSWVYFMHRDTPQRQRHPSFTARGARTGDRSGIHREWSRMEFEVW